MSVESNIKRNLSAALAGQKIAVFDGSGVVSNIDLSAVAANLAQVFFRFYSENGRMPAKLFNDGKLAVNYIDSQWYSDKAVVSTDLFQNPYLNNGYDDSQWLPILLVRVFFSAFNSVDTSYQGGDTQNYFETPVNIPAGWAMHQNNPVRKIPDSAIVYGAFQTWGILILALDKPELLFATDNGIMLTPEGVFAVQRSLPYWFQRYNPNFIGYQKLPDFFDGPKMSVFPFDFLQKINQQYETWKKQDNFWASTFGMVMSFVGFSFGASALSALAGGAISAANISGTVSLISKFGLTDDLNKLGPLLKIAGAIGGEIDLTSPLSADTLNVTGNIDMDFSDPFGGYDLYGDIGLDPDSFADFSDFSGADPFGGYDLWADIGIDPDSLTDFGSGGDVDMSLWDISDVELSVDEFNDLVGEMNQAIPYGDAELIQAADTAAVASVGPLSATQFAAAVKTAPQVASVAQAAIKQAGGNSANPKTNAQQAISAANIAQSASKTQGDIASMAASLLTQYANYQLESKRIDAKLPTKTAYPSSSSSAVRQPDGSISVRNSDGTITTVKPNGQSVTTGKNQMLPDFLSGNNLLIIGGVGLAAVLLLTMKRK